MQNTPLSSTSIRSLGYDQPSQTLEVEFLNGAIYQYYNVPENMYSEMMKASSKGKFLHLYIKNAYPFSRVG